jgi:hypothetical protein
MIFTVVNVPEKRGNEWCGDDDFVKLLSSHSWRW